jgi:hypothetical protein
MGEIQIYLKELAHMLLGVGKSKTHRAGQQSIDTNKSWCYSSYPKSV